MTNAIPTVPATPEYILNLLISELKMSGQGDFDSGLFTMDTPLHRFELAEVEFPYWPAPSWYDFWGGIASQEQWTTAQRSFKTLGDLCRFIAPRVRRPLLPTVKVFGADCRPAAAFLTIRQFLAATGADVADLAPSSKLDPWLRTRLRTFSVDLFRLAPEVLAQLRVDHPAHRRAVGLHSLISWGGFALAIPLYCLGFHWLAGLSCVLAVTLPALPYAWAARQSPKSVSVGSIQTFRELSIKIAAAVPQ